MDRNYLHHRAGDANNAILATVGYNFSLLIRWLKPLSSPVLAALAATPLGQPTPQPVIKSAAA
jgi:IS5 family transposase